MQTGAYIKGGFLVAAATVVIIQVAVEDGLYIPAYYPISPVWRAHLTGTSVEAG